jgi:hypothetical protein
MIQVQDNDGITTQRSYTFDIANIQGFEAILGYAWLQEACLIPDWKNRTWTFPKYLDPDKTIDPEVFHLEFETRAQVFVVQ